MTRERQWELVEKELRGPRGAMGVCVCAHACAVCVRVETGILGRGNGMSKGLEEAEGKSETSGTGGWG